MNSRRTDDAIGSTHHSVLAEGVSACLIVRNEAEHLVDCLRSLAGWVEEVCVVDTGSTDRTAETAVAAGAHVRTAPWTEDFSAARNLSLEMASHRWILVLDADERLTPESATALRRVVSEPRDDAAPVAWLVHIDSRTRHGPPWTHVAPRLFRNSPDVRFRRRVHESIMESLLERGVRQIPPSAIRLDHVGYLDAEVVRRKRRRNLRLLRLARRDDPEDLFVLYKLASSLREPAEQTERIAVLEHARDRDRGLTPEQRATHPFLPLVHDALAASLAARGRLSAALEAARGGRRLHPEAPELDGRLAQLFRRIGRVADALTHLEPTAAGSSVSFLPTRDPRAARARSAFERAMLHRMRGATKPARDALADALALAGDDLEARRLEVDLALDADLYGHEARELFRTFCRDHGATRAAWLLGARVARAEGDVATARTLLANAVDDSEIGHEARARLAIEELAAGELVRAGVHHAALRGIDLEIAAARVVLGVVAGRRVDVDPAFDRGLLLSSMVPWLQPLLAGGRDAAAMRFQENAPRYRDIVPRIDQLLAVTV